MVQRTQIEEITKPSAQTGIIAYVNRFSGL